MIWCARTDLDRLPPQHKESLSPLGQESGEFVDEDMFNLICLFDLDADTDTVDAWFDEDSFILVSCHGQGVQENFR